MFFFRKKKLNKKNKVVYDYAGKKPVLHVSICTGEKVAGFKDLHTGHFEDVMLIKTENDLELFCNQYGLERSEIKEEW